MDRRRAGRQQAASFPESARASHFSQNRGNHDDYTCDPQTPPPASPDGLQRPQLNFKATVCPLGLYPFGLLHSAGLRYPYMDSLCRVTYVREQEMGPLWL